MPRPSPPADLRPCEIKPAARGSSRVYLFHCATGWISRPMTRREATRWIRTQPKQES